MSKHGWYDSYGQWCEEECNAYCRNGRHAIVGDTYPEEEDGLPLSALKEALEHFNPTMRVLSVEPAPEVPHLKRRKPGEEHFPCLIVFEAAS